MEFAIILPVFALMLFGMIQFGLAFAGWDELRNAVQTSARVAANNGVTSSPNCGQPDPGSNLVCQVALSIGAPLDTAPTPLESLTLPESPAGSPEYSCTSPLQSCTGPGGGYSWLDGYYIFNAGQWLQIVNPNSPSCAGSAQPTCPPGQIIDSAAFSLGASTWTCASSGLLCSSIVTNVAGQNQNALGSDNIAINVDTTADQLQVCAQRQIALLHGVPRATEPPHINNELFLSHWHRQHGAELSQSARRATLCLPICERSNLWLEPGSNTKAATKASSSSSGFVSFAVSGFAGWCDWLRRPASIFRQRPECRRCRCSFGRRLFGHEPPRLDGYS